MKRINPVHYTLFLVASTSLALACSSSSSSNADPSSADGGPGGPGNPGGGSTDGGTITLPDGNMVQVTGMDSGGMGLPGMDASIAGFSALERKKAEMLTSIWENATTIFNYGYAINLNDGCGYTSGRVGFCTGTGDALLVLQCFDTAFGTGSANKMHKYVPALTALAAKQTMTGQSQADTSTIDAVGNYINDWKATVNTAATAPDFDGCQDQLVFNVYTQPALDVAKMWGLTQPLSIAVLYDSEVNHGQDGVAAFVKLTNTDMGNSAQKPASAPLSLANESLWLQHFIKHRLDTCSANSSWKHSVDRLAEYEQLRQKANWDMGTAFTTNAKAATIFANGSLLDSGYPACNIAADGTVTGDAECTTPGP